jgi:hypothetical protein
MHLYEQINENKKHPNFCIFVGTDIPSNYLLPGFYMIILGVILIYYFPMLLKIFINYTLIIAVYFLFHFILFSIVYLQINISLDFVNKILMLLGMFFSVILICNYNNFYWKNYIKNYYIFSLIIGIVLTGIEFLWINY